MKRLFARWPGDRTGRPADPKRCEQPLPFPGQSPFPFQCRYAKSVGKFCKLHAPRERRKKVK